VEFDWNKEVDYALFSVSDDFEASVSGCSLQLYRPLDLLLMSQEEAVAALKK